MQAQPTEPAKPAGARGQKRGAASQGGGWSDEAADDAAYDATLPAPIRIGDPPPEELLQRFIAWGDSGLKETTLRAYASNLRGIVKGEIMQGMPFPGLTKGMSLGDPKTVRIVRGARDYEEGGNQHYTALKKLLAFAEALEGSKARARKRRKKSGGGKGEADKKRPTRNDPEWDKLWSRLLKQGWRLETGTRAQDKFFMPPGVKRGRKEGTAIRRDYFDSQQQVWEHVESKKGKGCGKGKG